MDDHLENNRKQNRITETEEDLYQPSTSSGIVHSDSKRFDYKPEENDNNVSLKCPEEYLTDDSDEFSDDDEPDSESFTSAGIVETHQLIDAYSNFDPACIIPNPNNINITIFYDDMSDVVVDILERFAQLFYIKIVRDIENATIMIVKSLRENVFDRSENAGNAILKHIPIVTLKWVIECLNTNTLIAIDPFIPLDISDVSTPFISWSVGKGDIDSKHNWTKHIILYFHSSIELNSHFRCWAKELKFVIADDLEDLKKDDFELRIVLVDDTVDNYDELPTKECVFDWVRNYKALTVDVLWIVECLFQYKFVEIRSAFMHVQIPKDLEHSSGLGGWIKRENRE